MSLPVRERGSKLLWLVEEGDDVEASLPVRERGSKHVRRSERDPGHPSLPVRERGSKHGLQAVGGGSVDVAPRAGAWIET